MVLIQKKNLFTKLYRYYCRQLWQKFGMLILYTLIGLFYLLISLSIFKKGLAEANNWQAKLAIFWGFSILQLFATIAPVSVLVSTLTGRGLGWEEAKKRQFFRQPKLTREHDTRVIIFCPRITRKIMVSAKFATTFTYFMVLNFLFCLPSLIYFVVTTELGIMVLGSFLFLNGIIFGLINFTILVPFLFYSQEKGSILAYLLAALFIIPFILIFFMAREFVTKYPFIFILGWSALAPSLGYGFFSSYRRKFLTSDF